MNKLNIELMRKWVAALRSGKYEQTSDELKTTDPDGQCRYCCLGVLREIEPRIKQESIDSSHSELLDNESLFEHLGLSDCPRLVFDQRDYAKLNDDGKTFGEIATVLETDFPEIKQEIST